VPSPLVTLRAPAQRPDPSFPTRLTNFSSYRDGFPLANPIKVGPLTSIAPVSPLESALTENLSLSPLECALTKNTRGVGGWTSSRTQSNPSATREFSRSSTSERSQQ
jgi:hypothetical protein